jgi:hypothetical protein
MRGSNYTLWLIKRNMLKLTIINNYIKINTITYQKFILLHASYICEASSFNTLIFLTRIRMLLLKNNSDAEGAEAGAEAVAEAGATFSVGRLVFNIKLASPSFYLLIF